jgi:hypothetical protein
MGLDVAAGLAWKQVCPHPAGMLEAYSALLRRYPLRRCLLQGRHYKRQSTFVRRLQRRSLRVNAASVPSALLAQTSSCPLLPLDTYGLC